MSKTVLLEMSKPNNTPNIRIGIVKKENDNLKIVLIILS